jgi:hypothetical protein
VYKKLQGKDGVIKTAVLLEVFMVHSDRLSRQFLEYDTDGNADYFEAGFYLVLLFQKADGEVFTTLRSARTSRTMNKNKADYYTELRGTEFDVIIEK